MEALECLVKELCWLETEDTDPICVLHLRNIMDFAKSKQARAVKQKSVRLLQEEVTFCAFEINVHAFCVSHKMFLAYGALTMVYCI